QTGSSAMPHKRNPELCERVSGLARLVRGFAVTSMENITLWHERDISHSSTERVIIPGACLLVDYCLALFTSIMKGLAVFPQRMKKNMEMTKGLIFSQRVMLALIEKELSRQKAYELVQRNAMKAWKGSRNFLTLLKADPEVTSVLPVAELEPIFDYKYYLVHIDEVFQRLGLTKSQWKTASVSETSDLSPMAL
ncbi:MAG: adenylosuccinate lyase, partial [Chloroflexota bacterium]